MLGTLFPTGEIQKANQDEDASEGAEWKAGSRATATAKQQAQATTPDITDHTVTQTKARLKYKISTTSK